MNKQVISWTITKKEHFTRARRHLFSILGILMFVFFGYAIFLWQDLGASKTVVTLLAIVVIFIAVFMKERFSYPITYNLTENYIEIIKKKKRKKYYWNEIRGFVDLSTMNKNYKSDKYLSKEDLEKANLKRIKIIGKRFGFLLSKKKIRENFLGYSVFIQTEPENQKQIEDALRTRAKQMPYAHPFGDVNEKLNNFLFIYYIILFCALVIFFFVLWLSIEFGWL